MHKINTQLKFTHDGLMDAQSIRVWSNQSTSVESEKSSEFNFLNTLNDLFAD
jgi:hypothetical protein